MAATCRRISADERTCRRDVSQRFVASCVSAIIVRVLPHCTFSLRRRFRPIDLLNRSAQLRLWRVKYRYSFQLQGVFLGLLVVLAKTSYLRLLQRVQHTI